MNWLLALKLKSEGVIMEKLSLGIFKVNLNAILKCFIRISGIIFSLVGFIAAFIDFSGCFNSWGSAIIYIFIILFLIFIASAVITLFVKRKVVFCSKNQKKLTVAYGDLFEEQSEIKVIAVNRCFDTEVNDDLISIKTVHGKWIKKNPNINIEEQIESSLKRQGLVGIEVSEKRLGNKLRYPVGTVAEVKDGKVTYFLLALTEMNENLNTHCTLDDYCIAISKLMSYFDQRGQGNDMAMPIMGSGFSRLDRSEEELLIFMIQLIKIRQNKMRGNIKIIVHESLKSVLSIADL